MMSITKNRKIWFTLSLGAVILSIVAFLTWGLKLGIDFTGGSLLEVHYVNEVPLIDNVKTELIEANIVSSITIQPSGDTNHILRFETVTESQHKQIIELLQKKFGDIQEERFDSIGPTIGEELKRKTYWAMFIVLIAIIVYISWAFRKISKPVPSYQYGLIAIIALFHDVLIVIGIFALLGKFYGAEVNAPFVAALLTILGYSVNDTIVIFDRTRENLAKFFDGDFVKIIDKSVNESLVRSFNSSLTTLLVLLSIFFFGGQSIRNFVLALIIGVVVGTYSSIFLASPLLVWAQNTLKRK